MKLHTPLAWEIKRGYYETARICQTCYEKSAGIGLPNLPPVWPVIADLLAALSQVFWYPTLSQSQAHSAGHICCIDKSSKPKPMEIV